MGLEVLLAMAFLQGKGLWSWMWFGLSPQHLGQVGVEEPLWLSGRAELCLREMPRPVLKSQLRQDVRRADVGGEIVKLQVQTILAGWKVRM